MSLTRSVPFGSRLLPAVFSPYPRSKSDARSAVDLGIDAGQQPPPPLALKTTRDIPGCGFLWNTYWYFLKGYYEKTHELQVVQKKKYGPIWKSKLGPISVINVASADLIEAILRQEGRYPTRAYMPHWREYRELRGHAYGPLCEYGQEWFHIRSMLNPKMLKPKEVSNYSPAISEVVTDFVKKIRWVRETHGGGLMVNDISKELYQFAFEGICTILFETRMGCLEEKIPEETQKFIEAVFEMFSSSALVIFFPKVLWPYVSHWKKFVAAWDYIFYITEKLVNKKMKEIQENLENGKEVHGEYLTYLSLIHI